MNSGRVRDAMSPRGLLVFGCGLLGSAGLVLLSQQDQVLLGLAALIAAGLSTGLGTHKYSEAMENGIAATAIATATAFVVIIEIRTVFSGGLSTGTFGVLVLLGFLLVPVFGSFLLCAPTGTAIRRGVRRVYVAETNADTATEVFPFATRRVRPVLLAAFLTVGSVFAFVVDTTLGLVTLATAGIIAGAPENEPQSGALNGAAAAAMLSLTVAIGWILAMALEPHNDPIGGIFIALLYLSAVSGLAVGFCACYAVLGAIGSLLGSRYRRHRSSHRSQ